MATVLKMGSETTDLLGKVIGIADPVTAIQGIMEAAVAWPGAPWSSLTYDDMYDAQTQNNPLKAEPQEA